MQEHRPCATTGRREARREQRRDVILEVAARSFLEHGYAGTTMSAIASELGGSKGTLWNYFPSKEVLFGAVLDRATIAFRDELRVKLTKADSLEKVLGRLCETFISKLNSPEAIALQRLVVGEAGRFPEMGRIYYERAPQPTLELMAGYIGTVMEQGLLRRENPLHTAQYLVAMCTARSNIRLQTGVGDWLSPAEVREEARDAMMLFLRAYRPESGG